MTESEPRKVAGYAVDENASCLSGLEDAKRCVYMVLDASSKIVRRCCNRRMNGSSACSIHAPYVKKTCKIKGGQCRAIVTTKTGVLARCKRCRLKPEIPLCSQHFAIYKSGSAVRYEEDVDIDDIPDAARPVYRRLFKQRAHGSSYGASEVRRSIDPAKLKQIVKTADRDETAALEILLATETNFAEPFSSPKPSHTVVVQDDDDGGEEATPPPSTPSDVPTPPPSAPSDAPTPPPSAPSDVPTPPPSAPSDVPTPSPSPTKKKKSVRFVDLSSPSTKHESPTETPTPVMPKESVPTKAVPAMPKESVPTKTVPVMPKESDTTKTVPAKTKESVSTKAATPTEGATPPTTKAAQPKRMPEAVVPKAPTKETPDVVITSKSEPDGPPDVPTEKPSGTVTPTTGRDPSSEPPRPFLRTGVKVLPPIPTLGVKLQPKTTSPAPAPPKTTGSASTKSPSPTVDISDLPSSKATSPKRDTVESAPLVGSIGDVQDVTVEYANEGEARYASDVEEEYNNPDINELVTSTVSFLKGSECPEDKTGQSVCLPIKGLYRYDGCWSVSKIVSLKRNKSTILFQRDPKAEANVQGDDILPSVLSIIVPLKISDMKETAVNFAFFLGRNALMSGIMLPISWDTGAHLWRMSKGNKGVGAQFDSPFDKNASGKVFEKLFVGETYMDVATLIRDDDKEFKMYVTAYDEKDATKAIEVTEVTFERTPRNVISLLDLTTREATLYAPFMAYAANAMRRKKVMRFGKFKPFLFSFNGAIPSLMSIPRKLRILYDPERSMPLIESSDWNRYNPDKFKSNPKRIVFFDAPLLGDLCAPHVRNYEFGFDALGREYADAPWTIGDVRFDRDLEYTSSNNSIKTANRIKQCVNEESSARKVSRVKSRANAGYTIDLPNPRTIDLTVKKRPLLVADLGSMHHHIIVENMCDYIRRIEVILDDYVHRFVVDPWNYENDPDPEYNNFASDARDALLVLAGYQASIGTSTKQNWKYLSPLYEDLTKMSVKEDPLTKMSDKEDPLTKMSDKEDPYLGIYEKDYYAFNGVPYWTVAQAKLDAACKLFFDYVLSFALSLYVAPEQSIESPVDGRIYDLCKEHANDFGWLNAKAKSRDAKALIYIEARYQKKVESQKVYESSFTYGSKYRYPRSVIYDYSEWMISRWGTTWDPNTATRMGLSRPDTIRKTQSHSRRTVSYTKIADYIKYRSVHQVYPTLAKKYVDSHEEREEKREYDTYYLYMTAMELSVFDTSPNNPKLKIVRSVMTAWRDSRKTKGNVKLMVVVPSIADLTNKLIIKHAPGMRAVYDNSDEEVGAFLDNISNVAKSLKIDVLKLNGSLLDNNTMEDLFEKQMKDHRVLLVLPTSPEILIGDPGLEIATPKNFSLLIHYLTFGFPGKPWVTSSFLHNGCFRSLNEREATFVDHMYKEYLGVEDITSFYQRNFDENNIKFWRLAFEYDDNNKNVPVSEVNKLVEFLETDEHRHHFLLILHQKHFTMAYFNTHIGVLEKGVKKIYYYNPYHGADKTQNTGYPANFDAAIKAYKEKTRQKLTIENIYDPGYMSQDDGYRCGGWSLAFAVNQLNPDTCPLDKISSIVYYNGVLARPLYRYV